MWLQLHSWWVDTSVMAYLSLDEVLQGTGSLRVMASPTLREAIRRAATQVSWPVGEGVNVRDGWNKSDPLGKKGTCCSTSLGVWRAVYGGDYTLPCW